MVINIRIRHHGNGYVAGSGYGDGFGDGDGCGLGSGYDYGDGYGYGGGYGDGSGILWSISENDLKDLDIYEGFPTFYTRKTVHVWTDTITGSRMQQALVYIMTHAAKTRRDWMSYSDSYRKLCSMAARAAGIQDEFMTEAKQ